MLTDLKCGAPLWWRAKSSSHLCMEEGRNINFVLRLGSVCMCVCVWDGSPGVINVRFQSSKPFVVLRLYSATDYLLLQLTFNYKVTSHYPYTPSLHCDELLFVWGESTVMFELECHVHSTSVCRMSHFLFRLFICSMFIYLTALFATKLSLHILRHLPTIIQRGFLIDEPSLSISSPISLLSC